MKTRLLTLFAFSALAFSTTLAQDYNQLIIGANDNNALLLCGKDGTTPNYLSYAQSLYKGVQSAYDEKVYFAHGYGIFVKDADGSNLKNTLQLSKWRNGIGNCC
ncbi:MAG: hypothetical protein HRT57_02145 [Crocinitomicaceae bacterium]|nr:hypothetical protein [Crocinitomicaceae bacterium]